MIDLLDIISVIVIFLIPVACFMYFFLFQIAIRNALKQHHGEKHFNRWVIVGFVAIGLIFYYFLAKPRNADFQYEPSIIVQIFALLGAVYLAIEVPYQVVKMAAKEMAFELVEVADDKRETARLRSAETLASIVSEKLKVPCKLESFGGNEEFIFLTYIVNNKPIATRLKLNQADKAENWKKLGEWIITNYQAQNPQT
jgi:hypothetical protein